MNPELLWILELIATRRDAERIRKIESVASNFMIVAGLASATYLLPSVANTFYFIPALTVQNTTALTGACYLVSTNDGGASAGGESWVVQGAIGLTTTMYNIETESLQYSVGTFSAGTFSVRGTILKITIEPN